MREVLKKPWIKWLFGYGACLVVAVGLAYYWRVAFLLADVEALPFTLGVAGVFTVLYGALILLHTLCKDRLDVKATVCIFLLGVLFCFANAPLQAPDESEYFLRSYQISNGYFDYQYERDFPNDVALLYQHFPGAMNHQLQYNEGVLPGVALANYRADLQAGTAAEVQLNEPIVFLSLQFLPQAAGMALARLFGFSALGQLYAGRLANLLIYCVLCYGTFRNCNKYKGVFFAFALLPLSLFIGASLSYDCALLGLYYFLLSYFCKSEVTTRDLWVFMAAAILTTVLKPTSVVLLPVLLLIPPARWKNRQNPWVITGVSVVLGLVLYYVLGLFNGTLVHGYPQELPRGMGAEANPLEQVVFIVTQFPAFAARTVLTLYENAAYLPDLGSFGWLDLSLPLVGTLSLLSLSAASALGIQQKEDSKNTTIWALFLMALFYGCSILAALYVTETDLYSIRIVGVQMRYLLPTLVLLCMSASILLGKAVRPRLDAPAAAVRTQTITLWISSSVAFVAVLSLFQSNYIGQWLPKSEGGYELLNILGRIG